MNIKTISIPMQPTEAKKTEPKKDVRSDEASSDRDADGRRQQEGRGEKHEFTDAEKLEALKLLKGLPGVTENNLQIKMDYNNEVLFYLITDLKGNRVRRLSVNDVWGLMLAKLNKSKTGHLLNTAM